MRQALLTLSAHYFGEIAPVKRCRSYGGVAAFFVKVQHILVAIFLANSIRVHLCLDQVDPLKVARLFLTTSVMEEGYDPIGC